MGGLLDMDKTLMAVWVVDAETGEETLRDLKTGQVLAKKVDGVIREP